MPRKVSMSEEVGHALLEYRERAIDLGLRDEFRIAWQKILHGLSVRPLPPDESPETFGDLHYTTRHAPIHRICIACVSPLSVRFVVYEAVNEAGQPDQTVTIIGARMMFEAD